MGKALCIYHGNCADGFTAAWAVRAALRLEVTFHAGVYGQEPPDVTGRDVILVDFSYKRPVLTALAATARSILILDHHKSAAEDLAGFPAPAPTWDEHLLAAAAARKAGAPAICALFDMERSGARMAWDYFNGWRTPPQALLHVEDRDLWRFALPGTREIQAAIFSWPYEFGTWDDLMAADCRNLFSAGQTLERKHHKDVAELVAVTRRKMVIGGDVVPVANLPYTLTSDAGHLMCRGVQDSDGTAWLPPFAACYWDTPGGRVFSLRSLEGGADVSAIATRYGGGGHRHAAGFTMPRGWEGDDGEGKGGAGV